MVFDPVGGELFTASLRSIAWGGRILVIGFASGEIPQIPANLLLVKNAAAVGFYWGSYGRHDPARVHAAFEQLLGGTAERPHPAARLGDPPARRGTQRARAAAGPPEHRQGRADHAREPLRAR